MLMHCQDSKGFITNLCDVIYSFAIQESTIERCERLMRMYANRANTSWAEGCSWAPPQVAKMESDSTATERSGAACGRGAHGDDGGCKVEALRMLLMGQVRCLRPYAGRCRLAKYRSVWLNAPVLPCYVG